MSFLRALPAWLAISALATPLLAVESAPTTSAADTAPATQPAAAPAPAAATQAAVSPAPAAPTPASSPPAPSPAATVPTAPAALPAAQKPTEEDAILTEVAARATPKLKDLITRGDAALARIGQDDDQENVKRDIQNLIFEYDAFLRAYPNFTPGYVAYGLLLGKVGMRRQSTTILLKANMMNPDIPIVKNQLGNYLAEEGEPIEAANYFISATHLAPEEPLYHYQLGTLLREARDDFLKSGQWTRAQLDRSMQEAFRRAAELAPKNFAFAYRYAQSFNDLAEPNWEEALKVWGALEDQCDPGLEKETIRLQAANILIQQKKFDHARLLLATVVDEKLNVQKQKLLDQLPANVEK